MNAVKCTGTLGPPTAVWSRPELADALRFTRDQTAAYGAETGGAKREQQVWADLAHVLFNVKEFIYVN